MNYTNKDIWDQLSHFVNVIPQEYLNALLILHEKLGDKTIKWVLTGDLAESLRIVKVEPECIEIVTSKDDAQRIFQAVQEFGPSPIKFQTQTLSRNALIQGKEYLVYIRSYFFEFSLNSVKVKVQGDLQYKVGQWDWGDVFDFTPEYVSVVGKRIAVTPLSIATELYQSLGWVDRVDKIKEVTQKSRVPRPP